MKKAFSFALVPLIVLGIAAADVKLIARSVLNPRRVEGMLRSLLGTECSIGKIRYGADRIEVKDLRFPSRLGAPEGQLLAVDKISLAFSKLALATGNVLPAEITLDKPCISLLRTATGEWEIAELFKNLSTGALLPKGGTAATAAWAPALTIRNAILTVQDSTLFAPRHAQVFRGVTFKLTPFTPTRYVVEGEADAGALGRWTLKGQIDTQKPSVEITVSAPNLTLDRRLADTLNENIRSSWDNFLPNGQVDLALEITYNTVKPNDLDYCAVVDCHGVDFKYVNFPYATRAVSGRVEIRSGGAKMIGLEMRTVAARCRRPDGSLDPEQPVTRLRLDGWTDGFEREAAVNLRIDVGDMDLDENLKHALDKDAQRAWELFEPRGLIDGIARITRPHGLNVPEIDDITILTKGIHLRFQNFPYPVENCRGELQFLGKEIHIKHLTGYHGPAEVRLRGDIFDIAGETGWDVTADATGVPLLQDLRAALQPSLRRVWDDYDPSGTADITWRTSRKQGFGQPEEHHVTTRCRGVSACYKEIPYPLANLTGEIEYTGPQVFLRNLHGERGKTGVTLNGTVLLPNGRVGNGSHIGGGNGNGNGGSGGGHGGGDAIAERPGWDLEVNARNLALDDTLRTAVKSRLEETWQMFEPAGTIDLDWKSTREPGVAGRETQWCRATAKGVLATYREIPYPIPRITGQVEYDGTTVTLRNLMGGEGKETVFIDGAVQLLADRPPHVNVTIRGSEVPLDAKLIDAVPKELGDILASVTPSGSVDFVIRCDRAYAERAADNEPPPGANPRFASEILYSANVLLKDSAFDVGLHVSQAQGNLLMQGEVHERQHGSMGTARFTDMKIEGKHFSNVTSQFIFKNHWLNLHDLAASAYDGHLQGNLRVNTENYQFDGILGIAGLDLHKFRQDTFVKEKDVRGTLGADVRLAGVGKDVNQLHADGKLTISEGQLWDVPLFLNLMSSLNVTRRQPFQTGTVKFVAERGEIKIKSLEFESEEVKMTGKGSMDFDGNMDLLLDAGVSVVGVPEVPLLSPLVRAVRKQLFAVEVKGPFKSPSVGARILPSIGGGNKEDKKPGPAPAGTEPRPPRRDR